MAFSRCTYSFLSRILSNRLRNTHNSLGNNVSMHKVGGTTFLKSDNAGHQFLPLKDIPGPTLKDIPGPTLKDMPGPKPSVPFIGTGMQYFRWGRNNLNNIYEACIHKYVRNCPVVKEEFQWRKPVVHLYKPRDFEAVSKKEGTRPISLLSAFVNHYRTSNPEKYYAVGIANRKFATTPFTTMAFSRCPYNSLSRILSNRLRKTHNNLGNNVSMHKVGGTTFLNSDTAGHQFLTLKDIPGPKPSVPFIGTGWQYFRWGRYNLNNIYEACIDKYVRYGPVVKEEFQWRKPVVHLYKPRDFEAVSKKEGTRPIRLISEFVKHYRKNNPDKYDTVGIANSQGEEWERLRKILVPILMTPGALNYMMGPLNSICGDLNTLIRKKRDPETFCIHNLQDKFYKLSLESIFQMSLDKRLGCLDENLPEDSPAKLMINSAKSLFEAFQELYYGLPLWKFFSTAAYRKLDKAESVMYDLTNDRIQEVIEEIRNKDPEDVQPGVLQRIINTNKLSDKEIRVTVIDIITGGIFTMTNALTFLMYHMAANQDVQEKLYRELVALFPDKVVTVEGLEECKYINSCNKESFRLTPTIPTITRVLESDVEASGYLIPSGTPVFCNYTVPCMQSREFPEPERFKPERWMIRDHRKNLTLLPFGFGVRTCVGRRFAEMEMQTVLANLLLNFKLLPTDQKLKCKQAFIIVPSHPVKIIFKDRDSC